MTDDECRQIYTDAMELPNRNAVSVTKYIIAAHTEKLLTGVEMPERYDCVRDTERNVTEDVFTTKQLQQYAAAAALNARREALEEAKEVCECLIAPYGAHMPEKSVYDRATLDCASEIEALKGDV